MTISAYLTVFFLSTFVFQGSAFSELVPFVIKWILQGELFREYLVGYLEFLFVIVYGWSDHTHMLVSSLVARESWHDVSLRTKT